MSVETAHSWKMALFELRKAAFGNKTLPPIISKVNPGGILPDRRSEQSECNGSEIFDLILHHFNKEYEC